MWLAIAMALVIVHLPTSAWASHPTSRQFNDGSVPLSVAALLIGLFCVLSAAIFWRVRSGRFHEGEVYLKTTHFLPFAVQLVILSYWSMYWRDLPGYLPQIAVQIAFAYAVDATVAMVKDGRYRLTAGPLPIVGSINLFIQFPASDWPMQYGAIALAILAKWLLTVRGRHVINPSALGIAVIGLLNLAWPSLGNGDVAHVFDLPPNMTEVLLLVALVVQTRVPVVLVSAGCVAGLWLHSMASPQLNFSPLWSPVTLVALLLATDPATSPRTGGGRLLFGLVFGLLVGLTGQALTALGFQDFYAKILPLPLCNALVPLFDRSYERLVTRGGPLESLLSPARNRLHVAVFLVAMSAALFVRGKPAAFSGISHRYNATRFVHWNGDARADCSRNPLFCEAFTFRSEALCWVASLQPTGQRCGSDQRPRMEHGKALR